MSIFLSNKRRIFNLITRRLTDERYHQLVYLRSFGRLPNLRDPRTFSEKIIWRILFDRRAIFSQLTDKVGLRDYLTEIGLSAYLPKTYFIGQNPTDIHIEKLPKSFVAKPNHLSGHILAVDENNLVNSNDLQNLANDWLAFNHFEKGREWHYKDIQPKIIIEELLGEVVTNHVYKLHCFHGIPKVIEVGTGYTSENLKFGLYDMRWKRIHLPDGPSYNTEFSKPERLDNIVSIAAELSAPFDYVRVDLYDIEGRIVISEFTFTPTAGLYNPRIQLDLELGNFWVLPQ